MRLHCFESDRRRPRWRSALLWSAGAHALLVAAVYGGGRALAATDDAAPDRAPLFLLPLLPTRTEGPRAEKITYIGIGDGMAPGVVAAAAAAATVAPDVHGGERLPSVGRPEAAEAPAASDGSTVYMEEVLDRPVERDPASAGPEYPESLRRAGTQGSVLVEAVVDTTGLIDSTTIRVIASSHPLFSASVRAALPRARFRPAELAGQHVRQLVRQQFRFQLDAPGAPSRDSARTRDSIGG